MTFLNAALLLGLAALAIPPIVHLLNRRRYVVVDWAATMFLPPAQSARQRLRFDHPWLMLLRMLLLALFILAFAAPLLKTPRWLTPTSAEPRDIVVLIDGSASMAYGPPGSTPNDRAKAWLTQFLEDLPSQDRVLIVQVKKKPISLGEGFTIDKAVAANSLELLAKPSGTADAPAAVQFALEKLAGLPRPEIVILTDQQRFGWADDDTIPRWELIAKNIPDRPAIRVVQFPAEVSKNGENARLDPIRTDRAVAVAGKEITFRSTVRSSSSTPRTVRVKVDGRETAMLKAEVVGETGAPVAFTHRFDAGSHLVTFELATDAFAEDNRQDFALEVLPSIPVLIIGTGKESDFLRDALAPPKETAQAFVVRSVSVNEWKPEWFTQGTPPRVVVLANLEKLTSDQARQVERYLRAGGSVLITHGERADAAAWNRVVYRGGEGFLPARLNTIVGEVSPQGIANAPKPLPASFIHSAFEIFREPLPGGLATAYFPRHWKLDPTAGVKGATGVTMATLSDRDPWFIEGNFGAGRVIQAAVPLDDSWKTNLHRLPDFVRLAHELFYYLAGSRAADRNLEPGQPMLFTPRPEEPPGPLLVLGPDGKTISAPAEKWPATIETSGEPGAYKLTTPAGRTAYFAVRYDPRESNFTPGTDADAAKWNEALPGVQFYKESDEVRFEERSIRPTGQEIWWGVLLLVLGVLFAELWLSRRSFRTEE